MKTTLMTALLIAAASLAAETNGIPSAASSAAEENARKIQALWHPDERDVTHLWPEGKVPLRANDRPLKFLDKELGQDNVIVTDVNDPFFVFYRAKGTGPRPVAIILPGGGYNVLGINKEGTEIAEWLNTLGFSAAVLLYRAPDQRTAALCDVQRAIRLLRHGSERYGIDPNRVGVIGFSAGANLTVMASTLWRKRAYERVDAADDGSRRPDFQMPIYPWDLLERNDPTTPWKGHRGMDIRADYPVDAETPPAFIVQAIDDFCKVETAIAYDLALRRAGVDTLARIYANGGHGYGRRHLGRATDIWSEEAAAWLARVAKPMRKVLFLGDSITDRRHIGCRKNYWGYLADRYAFNPYVYGISGHQMDAIAGQADRFIAENPGVAPDVVFVFAGTNDYNANVPLGEWYGFENATVNRNGREVKVRKRTHLADPTTLRGRINGAMAHLREKFPLARFVLLTPLHRGFARFSDTNVQPDESYSNALGLFIDDYANVIREAGNVWAAKVIDLNAASGIYPNARGQDAFIHRADTDRLHPSSRGHERLAEAIAAEVGDWLK